ncbi:MAG: SH3 domain-containing protein [Aggregatilineales bacterium]
MKRVKLPLFIAMLLIISACDALIPASPDANAIWRAWLADENGRVVMVDARGRVNENAPLPAEAFINESNVEATFPNTNEHIALQLDTRFAHMDAADYNTIFIYDPIEGVNFPFFFSPTLNLQDVYFVQNGERVLVVARDVNEQRLWLLLERDGSWVRPLRNFDREHLHGTAQGFVYTLPMEVESEDGHETHTQLVSFETRRPLSDAVVWSAEGEWRILWVDSGASGYGPYRDWRPLAVPVYNEATSTPTPATPTPFPTPRPLLFAGSQAVVNTVDGEVLYLRDEASVRGEIMRYLYDRMIVDLLEGPVIAEGYTWWQIRTDEGEIGWAAEAVDTVTTLLPIGE